MLQRGHVVEQCKYVINKTEAMHKTQLITDPKARIMPLDKIKFNMIT